MMTSPEDGSITGEPAHGGDNALTNVVPAPTKTPLFQAIHAPRYQRQALIRQIEKETGRVLICYVAGTAASVERDDIVGFVDLLHNLPANSDVDLLLHTGGGDMDAAEKIITMVRTKVGNAILRVVVPDFAKSAGTLMALGADFVVMSDTSELGPIDPQVILSDGKGNLIRHSIQCHLDAYEEHKETLRTDPGNVTAQIMLGKLDPATIKLFEGVKERSRTFAEAQLKRGMFRTNGGNWSATVNELLDTKRWRSHAQMISWQDAQDPTIGLSVEYLSADDPVWQMYWQLHCLQRLAINDREKIFESDYVSITLEGSSH
jgi:Serine dehydrogenase proteinase